MNVTLILGNGFDLNMGLPTAYSDFYQYYMQVDTPKTTSLIKQGISDKPQTWADLEKSMGEISKDYLQDSDAYIEAFENARDELTKYLKEVERYKISNLNELASHFLRDILEIDSFLDNKPKQEYRQFLSGVNSCNDVNLSVINFNYTSTVEKMMAIKKEFSIPPKKLELHEVIHVHQNLETGILMGVNDETQIVNEAYGKDFDIRSMMVKPFINEMFAAGNDQKSYNAICNADIIVLFGTSFGETDEKWWNTVRIATYNRNTRIIYCPHEKNWVVPLHETSIIRKIHYFKLDLAKRLSKGNPSHVQDLYSKIYPIRNNHLFDFGFTQGHREEALKKIIDNLLEETIL